MGSEGRRRRVNPDERSECLSLISEAVAAGARKIKACHILELSVRTVERWEYNLIDRRQGPKSTPSNALTTEEKAKIIAVANCSEYVDLPPSQIVPRLADKGMYLGSESTFYRVLKELQLLRHRGRSGARTHKRPVELVAIKPNQIWSWDITYLKAGVKGTYFFLYMPLDIFSRKIVHWDVFERESAEYASLMIEKACLKESVERGQVFLHSDNGGPMKGATMLATLQRLGITPSFSRPHVSDDNPFSEALFRTMKYCPRFPERGFLNIDEAREWVDKFVHWYNNIHLHSGINFVTPTSKHQGLDEKILNNRRSIYEAAKIKNPNRWSKNTRNWSKIKEVELNPRKMKKMNEIELPVGQLKGPLRQRSIVKKLAV